jgi:GT2 family glycosyltransferase
LRLSILVVSRTAELLNALLQSLNQACGLASHEVEILCSWNGSADDEHRICNGSRYDLRICQRDPYHFAANMNRLGGQATGAVVLLANDDLVLDPGCIDAGLKLLEGDAGIGLVGALLRNGQDRLCHLGIHVDPEGSAYHVLDRQWPHHQAARVASGPVLAVTGALQWIRRSDLQTLGLNEAYAVCGEDVELCLDVQQHLGKQVWLCAEAQAIHQGESTRTQQPGQGANPHDQERLQLRYQAFVQQASPDQLRLMLGRQQWESTQLRALVDDLVSRHTIQMDDLTSRHANQLETLITSHNLRTALQQQELRQAERVRDELQAALLARQGQP